MLKDKHGFTLVEILIGILIFSIVIIGGFEALSAVTLGKIKLIEKTDITKEAIYFSEKLFDEIKRGGTIDYEEYFNRKVVGTEVSSGHYVKNTGFGNFGNGGSTPGTAGANNYGNGFYYCRSRNGASMGTGGCYYSSDLNDLGISGGPQRYGEYALQFIDYNGNKDDDLGDEDGDGKIVGDDDDENLGEGPFAFTGGVNIRELYLISGDRKKRTIFRWTWNVDPNKPSGEDYTCNSASFRSGCIGNIEFLKLEAKDWGLSHNSGSVSTGSFDGIPDTWIIDKEFTGGEEVIAGSNDVNYRQPLFPNSISVTNFEVYPYPNFDKKYFWKPGSVTDVNPYVRIKLTLSPSWKKRGGIKGTIPEIKIATTINLVDYFGK